MVSTTQSAKTKRWLGLILFLGSCYFLYSISFQQPNTKQRLEPTLPVQVVVVIGIRNDTKHLLLPVKKGLSLLSNNKINCNCSNPSLPSAPATTTQTPSSCIVIFSGGGDNGGSDQSEARQMKKIWSHHYEKMQPKPPDMTTNTCNVQLVLENESQSTTQNAFFIIPILHSIESTNKKTSSSNVMKIESLTIITNDFHVARTQLLFEQVFKTYYNDIRTKRYSDIVRTIGAPTIPSKRHDLFENEEFWLQSKQIKKLLFNMTDHLFVLPTTERLQQAKVSLAHDYENPIFD